MESDEVRKLPIYGLGVFARIAAVEGDIETPGNEGPIVDREPPLQPEDDEKTYYCDYSEDGKVVLMQFPERHAYLCWVPNVSV
jgi:hypothetical protein